MKTFPYLLLRKAGGDINNLEQLTLLESRHFIDVYFKLSDEIAAKGQGLKKALLQYFHANPHQKKHNLILNITRDIHNNKNLKSKTIDKVSTLLPADLYQALLDFENLKKKQETQKQNFITNYQNFKVKSTQNFLALADDDNFKSGLLLSSSILFAQLENISKKDVAQFKKKDYQIVNGLLKYYSRMLCKTALFSRFGTFSLARTAPIGDELCAFDYAAGKNDLLSFPKINLKVFEWLQLVLQNHVACRKQLYLALNNSLTVQEDVYFFLKNKHGVSIIQRLEKHALVELLLRFLETKTKVSLQDVLVFFEHNVDADEQTLMAYINQLIDIGLLELGTNISSQDEKWMPKLIAILDNPKVHKSILAEKIIETLRAMLLAEEKYTNSNLAEKVALIKTIYLQLNGLADFLQKENKIDATLAVFPLKKHAIFYEDCKADFSCKINAKIISEVKDNLTKLCQVVPHFPIGNFNQEQMATFFMQHYQKGASVNFMDFYFAYHNFVKAQKLSVQQHTYFEAWKKNVRAYFENKLDGREEEIHLNTEDLWRVHEKSGLNNAECTAKQSYSFFLQFYKKNGTYQAVVNNIFTGYGKMFGRFLHMLPDELTEALGSSLKKKFPDAQPIEIVEQTFFNANIHPNLAGREVILPGGFVAADEHVQTGTLKDFVVSYDAGKGLILKIKNTDQVCSPVDAGFQSPADLSEISRFLLAFSPTNLPGIYLINKAINDVWRKKNESLTKWVPDVKFEAKGDCAKATPMGMEGEREQNFPLPPIDYALKKNETEAFLLPRIIFKQKILLQRKTWIFPSATLPKKRLAEKEAAYFIRVQEWRRAYKIDKEVFIRYPKKITNADGTLQDYKPQYIHFESLLLVRLFSKMIANRTEDIFISEVLPGRGDALSIGAEKFVGEFLLQLEEA